MVEILGIHIFGSCVIFLRRTRMVPRLFESGNPFEWIQVKLSTIDHRLWTFQETSPAPLLIPPSRKRLSLVVGYRATEATLFRLGQGTAQVQHTS